MSERVSSAVNWLPRRAAIVLNDEASAPNSSSGRNVDARREIPVACPARAVDRAFRSGSSVRRICSALQAGHDQQREHRRSKEDRCQRGHRRGGAASSRRLRTCSQDNAQRSLRAGSAPPRRTTQRCDVPSCSGEMLLRSSCPLTGFARARCCAIGACRVAIRSLHIAVNYSGGLRDCSHSPGVLYSARPMPWCCRRPCRARACALRRHARSPRRCGNERECARA